LDFELCVEDFAMKWKLGWRNGSGLGGWRPGLLVAMLVLGAQLAAYATNLGMMYDSDGNNDGSVAAWGSTGLIMRYGTVTYSNLGGGTYYLDAAQVWFSNTSSPPWGTTLNVSWRFMLAGYDPLYDDWLEITRSATGSGLVGPGQDGVAIWDIDANHSVGYGLACEADGKLTANSQWQAWLSTGSF
jgi:hypothetical protein